MPTTHCWQLAFSWTNKPPFAFPAATRKLLHKYGRHLGGCLRRNTLCRRVAPLRCGLPAVLHGLRQDAHRARWFAGYLCVGFAAHVTRTFCIYTADTTACRLAATLISRGTRGVSPHLRREAQTVCCRLDGSGRGYSCASFLVYVRLCALPVTRRLALRHFTLCCPAHPRHVTLRTSSTPSRLPRTLFVGSFVLECWFVVDIR